MRAASVPRAVNMMIGTDRLPPDPADQLHPVDLGKHGVDQRDVDGAAAQERQGLEAAARLQHLERPRVREAGRVQCACLVAPIVLDDPLRAGK